MDNLKDLGNSLKSMLGMDAARDANPLSYSHILDDIWRFRNQKDNEVFGSKFEDPGTFYFKVFFYFNNTHDNDIGLSSNLLGSIAGVPEDEWEWEGAKGNDKDHYVRSKNVTDMWAKYKSFQNTALGYLISMGQDDRAHELSTFINILSNISSETPWMIKGVEGLSEVLNNYIHPHTGFVVPEEPKSIKLKLLQEPYDMRITTLINSYRDAVIDKYRKLVIIPENLRKFDMGIYIFPAPYYHMTRAPKVAVGGVQSSSNYYNTGSIYIELHDCEFNILNGYEALDTLDNETGKQLEYSLEIIVGQAFITSYNEFLDACMGDIFRDVQEGSLNNDATVNTIYNFNKGLASKIMGQLMEKGEGKIASFAKKVVLGNLYGLSPKNIWDNMASGNVGLQTIGQMKRTLDDLGIRRMDKKGVLRNLYDTATKGVNTATRRALDWDTDKNWGKPNAMHHRKKLDGYGESEPFMSRLQQQNAEKFGFTPTKVAEPTENPLKNLKLSGYENLISSDLT